jgi:hypothetical protein
VGRHPTRSRLLCIGNIHRERVLVADVTFELFRRTLVSSRRAGSGEKERTGGPVGLRTAFLRAGER